jgi:hypothetical protein
MVQIYYQNIYWHGLRPRKPCSGLWALHHTGDQRPIEPIIPQTSSGP